LLTYASKFGSQPQQVVLGIATVLVSTDVNNHHYHHNRHYGVE
jgi:hypothetical protein